MLAAVPKGVPTCFVFTHTGRADALAPLIAFAHEKFVVKYALVSYMFVNGTINTGEGTIGVTWLIDPDRED